MEERSQERGNSAVRLAFLKSCMGENQPFLPSSLPPFLLFFFITSPPQINTWLSSLITCRDVMEVFNDFKVYKHAFSEAIC